MVHHILVVYVSFIKILLEYLNMTYMFHLFNYRGVAQFLKDYSPCTPISEVPAEDFSLNKILEGKTRKIAARMFFEVLVSFLTFSSFEMNFDHVQSIRIFVGMSEIWFKMSILEWVLKWFHIWKVWRILVSVISMIISLSHALDRYFLKYFLEKTCS